VAAETLTIGDRGVNVAVGARVGVFVEVAEGVAEGVAVGVDVAVIGGRLASASTVLITAVSNKSASLRVGTAQAARTSKPPVDIKAVRDTLMPVPRKSGGV
jgi:hypothetical protein